MCQSSDPSNVIRTPCRCVGNKPVWVLCFWQSLGLCAGIVCTAMLWRCLWAQWAEVHCRLVVHCLPEVHLGSGSNGLRLHSKVDAVLTMSCSVDDNFVVALHPIDRKKHLLEVVGGVGSGTVLLDTAAVVGAIASSSNWRAGSRTSSSIDWFPSPKDSVEVVFAIAMVPCGGRVYR